MKRRAEFLVEKRDGRTEWLRATKLARSIHLALHSAGIDEDWRALELAAAVLSGLRARQRDDQTAGRRVGMLTTAQLADAVAQVLVATGVPVAAAAYGLVASERTRRRRSLELLAARAPADAGDAVPAPEPRNRLGRR
jgi:hypothetical protein